MTLCHSLFIDRKIYMYTTTNPSSVCKFKDNPQVQIIVVPQMTTRGRLQKPPSSKVKL